MMFHRVKNRYVNTWANHSQITKLPIQAEAATMIGKTLSL